MDAIVLAAGNGSRMNLDYPKQFHKINGKPIFIFSLEILEKSEGIDNIILACNKDYVEKYKKFVKDFDLKRVIFVEGGKSRQESVFNALKSAKTDKVIIHEAARPLISQDFLENIMSYSDEDAVIPTLPVKFTVSVGTDYMSGELERSTLRNIQLPQMFTTKCLIEAHNKAISDGYVSTEDGSLIFHYGGRVRFVEGRESNIKVTTSLDIEIVNKLMKF